MMAARCCASSPSTARIFRFGDPAQDLAAWQPDIVLLQDAYPHQVRHIADVLYGGRGDYRAHATNGIVTRWKIQREVRNPTATQTNRSPSLCRTASAVEVVNVHLPTAATDLRFWQRATWRDHRDQPRRPPQRTRHRPTYPRTETTDFSQHPHPVRRRLQLPGHRRRPPPAHAAISTTPSPAAGTGWGNTYPAPLPVLRIDHLYATRHFTPVRCRAVTTRHSDHRMVVADFLLKDGRTSD